MCEQTEINYLDGDIVWVKLGACWWPGQVTSFHNLPEDIQIEFQKKPLIAAVKFFQEDTYEFVKNLHQIYKYNCTQKDDFIKKGLDKCRTKSKDGSSYMAKFPGDVEMAEKLTGGDPDILTSEKFCREEKPDISALFGEKKIPKKKRDRDEMNRRSSDGNTGMRKITHPRFLRESDHEIRIRQQPSSLGSTPKTANTDSPQYSCHLCNFTSTRVNVIICHRKSHCSDGGSLESPLGRGRITSYTAPKSAGRPSLPADTQKRKYVRKTKSLSSKGKISENEPVKRKLGKQMEKTTAKKKKTDPELREKLLADWDDESDEDMDLEVTKSTEAISTESPSLANNSAPTNNSAETMEEKEDDDGSEILNATEKLLRETDKYAALHTDDSSSQICRQSNNKHLDDLDSETDTSTSTLAKDEKSPAYKKPKKLIASTEDRKSSTGSEKDDKQSRFSCFDFDEEDLPEPTITPVRKIPRIFGEKNTSVKKEILKKFKLSQAMKNSESKYEAKEKRASEDQITTSTQDFFDNKEPTAKEKKHENFAEEKNTIGDRLSAKEPKQRDTDVKIRVDVPTKSGGNDETPDKISKPVTVTELEIVEIFEVEGEKDEREETDDVLKKLIDLEIEPFPIRTIDENVEDQVKSVRVYETGGSKNDQTKEDRSRREKNFPLEKEETMSELATTETEDETISEVAESLRGNSENSDTDGNLNRATWSVASSEKVKSLHDDGKASEKPVPRRRGRPRKSLSVVDPAGNAAGGNDSPKHEIIGKKVAALASRDSERKTSESDSERSYSGRRRKPNKKYLHSDLYTSSPDNRASKTDESQSETEEKTHKEHKGNRARRGKKKPSLGSAESHVESLENKNTDREFEFSNRTLDTTDEATNSSKNQEQVSRVNEITESKSESLETEAELSASCVTDFSKKLDSGIGSPVHITKFMSPADSEPGSMKNIQDRQETTKNEKSNESKDKCDKIIEPVIMDSEDIEMHANDAKSGPKFDAVKSIVDKLPPKKSQIKKFELSQIDLLDACEEQVAAEQAAAEKRSAADKLAAEKVAAEKLAAEKLAAETLAAEKLAAEKLASEKLIAEKLAAEKLAAEKLAAEKLAAEKLAAEKLAAEKLAAEKLAAEKLAAEKLAAEKSAAERLATEKLAAEKLAAEKIAAEQLAAEKLAAEQLAAEKLAAEKLAIEQAAAEKAEAEKRAKEEEEKEEEERKRAAEKQAAEEAIIADEKLKDEPCDKKAKLDDVNLIADVSSGQSEKMVIQDILITKDKIDSPSVSSVEKLSDAPATDSTMETIEAVLARITNEEEVVDESSTVKDPKTQEKAKTSDTTKIDKNATKETSQTGVDNELSQRSSSQTRFKGKLTPEGLKVKKGALIDEEIPINSFQEAFLKTLHIDKKDEKDGESTDVSGRKSKQQTVPSTENTEAPQQTIIEGISAGNRESLPAAFNNQEAEKVQPLNAMTEFEGVEILVQDNIVQVETKIAAEEEENSQNQMDLAATLVGTDSIKHEGPNAMSLDLQKIQDTLSDRVSTPSPSSETSVPVKKREKPRIIENVALKEPMQILKNKLLEKLPSKSAKHKLDVDGQKKGGDSKSGGPRAKIMKIDSPPGNSKAKSPTKSGGGSHFTITRKLQVLKAEEAIEKEKASVQAQIAQALTLPTGGEKFIQQSSQSLADIELDINSMPFVLSEDVLTPESIEHMPVVISSIIPSSSTSAPPHTSLTHTTTAQIQTSNSEVLYKSTSTSETTTTESPPITGKKKSGTPAILKNKAKAKPTITSIKTLVPPFAGGGVKGLKFQSQQSTSGKAMPLMSQKNTTPGKYVIVQTAGGQQMRYSVQGKTGSQHKIAIPAGKATGSAQIVQQGGKVVILTSAQSGQTKMLPLNISKSMSGKVQKIVNNKGQIYAPISPQGIIGQKTIIAPKTDTNSPTTSKLGQGQKMLNAQGIITSKGVLTPISTSKSGLLGTLSQGILTKGGIYTPISSGQLAGKTIIGSKTLVSKATTILSPLGTQTLGTSKGTILAPMSHTITGKTLINAQGLVTPKGTVLTPITGQQVKAIAAKSPAKGAKIHYQPVQQKLQLPMLQKCQKIPVSSSSQMRAAGSIKSSSGTIVFHNTVAGTQKTPSPGGKKIVRQIAQQTIRSPQTTTMTTSSTTNPSLQQPVLHRAKSLSGTTLPTVQKITTPRAAGRQTKPKIVVQKITDATQLDGNYGASPVTNMQSKPIMSTTVVGNVVKTPISTTPKQTSRTMKSGRNAQKNLLNVSSTSSVSTSSLGSNETLVVGSVPIQTQTAAPSQSLQNLPVPPLVIPGTELPIAETEASGKTDKSHGTLGKESSNKQEPAVKPTDPTSEESKLETANKVTAQPQIMALPTESSDGTQTYVLVTIDEQGQIQPLDNNTLMSLEGTTQNADGTRTLYIDPSSLGDAGTLDNLVIQFDNAALPNLQASAGETSQTIVTPETFPSTEIIQTSNQDILAAALANTDFQQEIGLPDNATSTVMTTGLTQTSLINQTILQSTIIPPTEPISSPSVLETSLTLNQPIMTPLEVPSNLPIQIGTTPASVVSTIPTSLELPITITDPSISYISVATTTPSERHIQIPGNSMPDIGEIMESSASGEIVQTDIPTSTRYLVLPTIDESMTTIQSQENDSGESPSVTYSVSIPDNASAQTTPSMPIIDDGYVEATEQRFSEVTINEMLVSKASETGGIVAAEINDAVPRQESTPETSIESQVKISQDQEKGAAATVSQVDSFASHDAATTEQIIVEGETVPELEKISAVGKESECSAAMQIDEQSPRVIAACCSTPVVAESCSSEMQVETESSKKMMIESTEELRDSSSVDNVQKEITTNTIELGSLIKANRTSLEEACFVNQREHEQINTSNLDSSSQIIAGQAISASINLNEGGSSTSSSSTSMVVEEAVEMEIYPSETPETPDGGQQTVGASSQAETMKRATSENVEHAEIITEASQEEEAPSQSYEQFNASEQVMSDSTETPSQSAAKSESSREATQSVAYEAMEVDENTATGEPPTQSFEDTKRNEASQSYEPTAELNTNAPTQSFNEIMQCQQQHQQQQHQQQHQQQQEVEEPSTAGDAIDDQSFPTQSYEVGKIDNLSENLESDASSAIGQEGNIPSQSNDVGNDGIGTSSVSINNSGLNEDETASSSYVPETPENQERDQDQESAISTSSYEIPPCEELNIASSSVIPDTSVRGEHMSIHDNGVPEIPTSSYNLNPDSSSTSHVDTLPTSSYEEDQVIVEQNVSTSYEVPISMPGSGIEENSSQNFVTESTDHRNEPTSYYARHPEVSASYYEAANQDSNSRLEADPQEEVTPSYYEQPQDITSEASQSYFRPTPRYSSQSVSPSYYDPTPETEASQSSYYSHEIETTEQSSSRNVEASQSFYQETTDERRLRQQGEATPTYTERYPVDYALASSPIERHDLVESSVPATRPTERDDRA